MMKFFRCFLCIVLLALVSVSCFRPEDFDTSNIASDAFPYDIAMPLTDTRLTLDDIIDPKGGLFVSDENGLLHLVYSTEPFEKKFIDDPTIDNHALRISRGGIPYVRLDTLLSFSSKDSIVLSVHGLPDGTEIQKLYLRSIKMRFTLSNSFMDALDLTLRFPNVKDASGVPVSLQRRVEGGKTEEVDLEFPEVYVEMEGSSPYVLRESEVRVDMRGMTEDSAVHVGSYGISGNLYDLIFRRLEGSVGSQDFSFTGSLPVAGLGLERMEDIRFNAATINTSLLVDGVSAPVRIDRSSIQIHNQKGVHELEVFDPGYDVPYPSFDKVPLREESFTQTDVKDLLVDRPSDITFSVRGRLNPDGARDPLQVFEHGARIRMLLDCDVPAWFSASGYILADTMPMTFDEIDDDTQVNYFDLKTIFKNAFPLDFDVDIVFLKRDRSVALVLCENRFVESAVVGSEPDLHVTTPTVMNFEDELNDEQVAAIRQAAYVVIRAKINTYQKGDIKIYMPSENEGFFAAKMGFRVKVSQNLF